MITTNDTFSGVPAFSLVAGTVNNAPYFIYAIGFAQVQAYAGGNGSVAYLATSAGSDDLYYGTDSYSEVRGSNYLVTRLGFTKLQAYYGGGLNQIAYLQDLFRQRLLPQLLGEPLNPRGWATITRTQLCRRRRFRTPPLSVSQCRGPGLAAPSRGTLTQA